MFCVCIKPFLINIYIYNISCIYVEYRCTVQCPLIKHDNSGVRIIMLLNVLNVYRFK